jgi:hypothetical protein
MTSGHEPFPDQAADASSHQQAAVPFGIDPEGVLPPRGGRDAFILFLAATIALLALIFTLGWVVYHQLTVQQGSASFGHVGSIASGRSGGVAPL